jgi:hypothetical protein
MVILATNGTTDPFGGAFSEKPPAVPIVPLPESGASIVSLVLNGNTLSAESPPCDKQFPWRSLAYPRTYQAIRGVIGLTLHGELYYIDTNVQGFSDAENSLIISGGILRAGVITESLPRRIYSPDINRPIQSVSVPASGAVGLSRSLFLLTDDGRLFALGSNIFGQHAVAKNTEKEGATLRPPGGVLTEYDSEVGWTSQSPVATEINLPGGVIPQAIPKGSSNSAIGRDGNLYAWWADPRTGFLQTPKRVEGFVKSATITHEGSRGRRFANPSQKYFVSVAFSAPPSGGTPAVAYVEFDPSTSRLSSSRVYLAYSGYGYTSAPTGEVATGTNQFEVPEWEGNDPPRLSSELFSGSFIADERTGNGWLLEDDGTLYQYIQPIFRAYGARSIDYMGWLAPIAPLRCEVFPNPIKWKFASGNCLIDRDGNMYVLGPKVSPGNQFMPFDYLEQSGFMHVVCRASPQRGLSIDSAPAYVGSQFMARVLALYKIGSNYVSGACTLPLDAAIANGGGGLYRNEDTDLLSDYSSALRNSHAAIAGVKQDGSLWTAGSNHFGLLGDTTDRAAFRRAMGRVASNASWLTVETGAVTGLNYPVFDSTDFLWRSHNAFYAIRKDAICREIDQPMEYYPDSYYRTLQ